MAAWPSRPPVAVAVVVYLTSTGMLTSFKRRERGRGVPVAMIAGPPSGAQSSSWRLWIRLEVSQRLPPALITWW